MLICLSLVAVEAVHQGLGIQRDAPENCSGLPGRPSAMPSRSIPPRRALLVASVTPGTFGTWKCRRT